MPDGCEKDSALSLSHQSFLEVSKTQISIPIEVSGSSKPLLKISQGVWSSHMPLLTLSCSHLS